MAHRRWLVAAAGRVPAAVAARAVAVRGDAGGHTLGAVHKGVVVDADLAVGDAAARAHAAPAAAADDVAHAVLAAAADDVANVAVRDAVVMAGAHGRGASALEEGAAAVVCSRDARDMMARAVPTVPRPMAGGAEAPVRLRGSRSREVGWTTSPPRVSACSVTTGQRQPTSPMSRSSGYIL